MAQWEKNLSEYKSKLDQKTNTKCGGLGWLETRLTKLLRYIDSLQPWALQFISLQDQESTPSRLFTLWRRTERHSRLYCIRLHCIGKTPDRTNELIVQVGEITDRNLVTKMLHNCNSWKVTDKFVKYITKRKEEAEQIRQEQPMQQVNIAPISGSLKAVN